MTYQTILQHVKRRGVQRDGYNGTLTEVGLAWHEGRAWLVAKCGFFGATHHMFGNEQAMLDAFDRKRKVYFPSIIAAMD